MDKVIRILCVFSKLDRGGAETMCMNLYRRINRNCVQFDFVKHTHEEGAYEHEILSLGGQIYEAPRFRFFNYCQYRNWWIEHLRENPHHRIIHGHYFTISAVYFRIAKHMNRYTVGHSHSTGMGRPGVTAALKTFLKKRVESYSDYCLACSIDAGRWLFPQRDVKVINNAIDIARFRYDPDIRTKIRREVGLEGSFVVGIVGNFTDAKNPFGVIEIFKAVHRRDFTAKLLWIGDGRLRSETEKSIINEGIQDAVIMTGVRSDVERLMQAMDVFILPSLWEGLPVVLVEAQCAGLPCFASETVSREAGITELCHFLPLNQPELWAEKILGTDVSERRDTSPDIKAAGYDVGTTAKWLQDFYLQINAEIKD